MSTTVEIPLRDTDEVRNMWQIDELIEKFENIKIQFHNFFKFIPKIN